MFSSKNEIHVVVIMPTYNRWHKARQALRSLEKSVYKNYEIVLIEDGCTDGTPELCRSEFPNVHVLHGDGNLWWSGAINIGMDYALSVQADAVVWLNDDDQVNSLTLQALVDSFIRVGKKSIICSRVKSTVPNSNQELIEQYPPIHHPDFRKKAPKELLSDNQDKDIIIEHPAGGHGVLFSIECIKDIGFVDAKRFPQYWGDHDYHYRAIKAGYRYYVAVDAIVLNAPNEQKNNAIPEYTLKWFLYTLFSKYSANNILQTFIIVKRHSLPAEKYLFFYRKYITLLFQSFLYEWIQRHETIRSIVRYARRHVSKHV